MWEILGIAVVSNLLKYLLAKHESKTLGLLLGLLIGAVVGLYPFQAGVKPQVGDVLKGQTLIQAKILLRCLLFLDFLGMLLMVSVF